jgi:hypothetical protein
MPAKKATTFFVNSDQKHNDDISLHREWIRLGIALTSGPDKFRVDLNEPKRGDTLLLYVNRVGVVAAGRLLDDEAQIVSPGRVSLNETIEYHRKVDWCFDISENPLSYQEIMRVRGSNPSSTIAALRTGEEEIIAMVAALAEQRDLKRIQYEYDGRPTEALAIMQARLGQGKFREDLLALWDGQCAVTACGVGAVLRASHVKPWAASSHEERLDPDNGLLLVATLDALFDRGLISFTAEGEMLCSPALSIEERARMHLPASLRKPLNERQKSYLQTHRERFAF